MQPIEFKQSNVTYAKDQPEYLPLPAYIDRDDPQGRVISCWKLTWRERFKIFFSGRMFLSQMTFKQALQPQLPEIDSPFVDPAEHKSSRPDVPPPPPKKAVG